MLSWQGWSVQQCLWHAPGLLEISLWRVKLPLWMNQTTQWVRKPQVQLLPQDEAQKRVLFLRPYISNIDHDHSLVLEEELSLPHGADTTWVWLQSLRSTLGGISNMLSWLCLEKQSTEIHLPIWPCPLMSDKWWSSIPSHHQLQDQMGFRNPDTWEVCSQAFPCSPISGSTQT